MRSDQPSSAADKFQQDKKSTLNAAQTYIDNNPAQQPFDRSQKTAEHRNKAGTLISEAASNPDNAKDIITQSMQSLEKARDARTGIDLIEVPTQDGSTPTIIRDARNGETPAVRGPEGAEIQYLNVVRAALDIAEIEGKPELKAEILRNAQEVMASFQENSNDLSTDREKRFKQEKALLKLADEGKSSLKNLLEENGIPNAHNKLTVAKDFQGLNSEHHNVATLSSVTDKDGVTRTAVEADIGYRELTEEQKREYQSILDPNAAKPEWYSAMPWWEKELVQEYAPAILDGNHTLATQLTQIVGMKNTFEKVTAVTEQNSTELKTLRSAKHSGTLASFAEDKGERSRIAGLNIDQAQEWVGKDTKLHVNSLNSKGLGNKDDKAIVNQLGKASKEKGFNYSNTAFNAARMFGNANVTKGTEATLNSVRDSFKESTKELSGKEKAAAKVVAAHLEPKPKGMFATMRRFMSHPISSMQDPNKALETLQKGGVIDEDSSKILKSAVTLRQSSDKLRNFSNMFGGNPSLDTSRELTKLNDTIRSAQEKSGTVKGLESVKAEDTITMCKSGKDRTALSLLESSSDALADELGVSKATVDKAIVKSGHGQQQAGGVYSAGSSAGCFGTKDDNRFGIGDAAVGAVRGTKGRTEEQNTRLELIEKTASGADKLKLDKKGKNPDSTAIGHDKETEHQQEVQVRKEELAQRREESQNMGKEDLDVGKQASQSHGPQSRRNSPATIALDDNTLAALNAEGASLKGCGAGKGGEDTQVITGEVKEQSSGVAR